MDNDKEYKSIFRDVCHGYSFVKSSVGNFFVKHINYEDQILLDDLRKDYFDEAKKRGLPTTEEALANLKEENLWTSSQETDLNQEESFLLKLENNKKNLYLKSEIDSINKQIEFSKNKINDLKNQRNSLLGNTCENHADQKVTEEFLRFTFYKDKNLKTLSFEAEEFDELETLVIAELVIAYNKSLRSFSDDSLQKLVLQDFFSYYMPFCEDPIHFYGQPVIKLTYNQLRLILYSRYFKNILTNNDKIPDEYRKDPEKIIDYVNANEKAKKMMENKDNAATSIVGATKEDYEYLNLTKNNAKQISLSEAAKKKGGSLNMKDLMNLMGEG
jgi:hypothetical protein